MRSFMRQIFKLKQRDGDAAGIPCAWCDEDIEPLEFFYAVKSELGAGVPADYRVIHKRCRDGFQEKVDCSGVL